MGWPLSQDYNEVIQDARTAFADPELRAGEVATNALGLPLPRSGNFADVYEVKGAGGKGRWAVKCFTRQVAGLRERYAAVSAHLAQSQLPFTVDFQYLEQGIRVRGQWYPVLKMQWVEGLLLNEFVRDNLEKPPLLNALSQIWLRMAKRLREASIAHADLQHGNVILVPGSTARSLAVKLIDYDGMFVPALAGKKSGEVGHPNYQHPQRLREGTCSGEVDRFPLLVVATALRALAVGGRALWERHDNGDNLLFKETDLRDPEQSPVFADLLQISDPLTQKLVGCLRQGVTAPLEATPPLTELVPEERPTTVQARPTGGRAAEGPDWNFAAEERELKRRPRKSGVPVWAWAGGAAAVLLLLGGGILLATRGGSEPKEPSVVAQGKKKNDTTKTRPTTQPAKIEPAPPVEIAPPGRDPAPQRTPEENPLRVTEPVVQQPVRLFRLLGQQEGRWAAAAFSGQNTWLLYNVSQVRSDRSKARELSGHEGPVTCICATADQKYALTGSEDKTLRFWDLESGESKVLRGHDRPVVAVALSPDGTQALSADRSATVLVWDVDRARLRGRLDNAPHSISAVAFSPSGDRAALGVCDGGPGQSNPIDLVDLKTRQLVRRFPGHTDAVTCLAFSPDGTRLVSGGMDGIARFWDTDKEDEQGSFSNAAGPVQRVLFSANGGVVLVGSETRVSALNAATRAVIIPRDRPPDTLLACSFEFGGMQVMTATIEPDGTFARFSLGLPRNLVAVKSPMPPPTPKPPRRRPPQRDFRHPVPEATAVAKAEKELHEHFKDLYAQKSPNLREKLYHTAVGADDWQSTQVRYVALKELQQQAAEKGDLREALRMADILAQRYAVTRLEARSQTVEQAALTARAVPHRQAVVEHALGLIEEAKGNDDWDMAARLAEVAFQTSKKAGKESLAKAAVRTKAEVDRAQAEFQQVKPALEKLADDPGDADANLAVGRFRCVHLGAWEEGLPMLARGSDSALKVVARKDLDEPATATDRRAMAEIWYSLGLKTKDAEQAAWWRRAYHWYRLALPGLPPADQVIVKQRQAAILKIAPELADRWWHLDLSELADKDRKDFLHLEPRKCVPTRRYYRGGVDITVVARTTKNNIRLVAGQGGRLIFNWEGQGDGLHIDRPDNPFVDSRGWNGGSRVATRPVRLTANQWHTLRWQLTPTGMKVWVDGELVFEKAESYDLSHPRPVAVCSFFDSPIDVKSVTVKGLPTEAPKD